SAPAGPPPPRDRAHRPVHHARDRCTTTRGPPRARRSRASRLLQDQGDRAEQAGAARDEEVVEIARVDRVGLDRDREEVRMRRAAERELRARAAGDRPERTELAITRAKLGE